MARADKSNWIEWIKWKPLTKKKLYHFFHFREMPLTNTEHLNVKHLSVGYHYPVLSDINFTVNGGQKL